MARRPVASPSASPIDDPLSHAKRRSADVLRRLELDVTRRLDGILHGEHQGLVPGHGSEPGEAREYQPGDDVRRIDWNVTARSQHAHIRETIADRELEAWIIADRSASLDFGTHTWEKRDLALAASAGIGFLTSRGGNRVGAIISGSDGIVTLPARSGRAHLMAILRRIDDTSRTDGVPPLDLNGLLQRGSMVAPRRGLVAVISDFLDDPETWKRSLAVLAMRHQVLCIEVLDPRELELPDVGVLTLVDPESGRVRHVDTGRKALRERYAAAATEQRNAIAAAIRSAGASHLRLRTDEDWLEELARYVTTSRRKRANAGRNVR